MKTLFHKLRNGVIAAAALLLAHSTQAQVNTYVFQQVSGTFTPMTGGTVLGTATNDDNAFTAVPMGFNFTFNGIVFNSVGVCANGWIKMGATPVNSYTPLSGTATYDNTIAGFARDLQGFATGGSLKYQTTGTAPNRVFIVEWLNYRHWSSTNANNINVNFQIRLSETSNTVEVVYGNCTMVGTGLTSAAQVGIRGTGATLATVNSRLVTNGVHTWPTSVQNTATTSTCGYRPTPLNLPTNGLIYRWTPPAPSPVDIRPTALVLPAGSSCGGTNQTIRVTILNNGTTVHNFTTNPVTINVNVTGAAASSWSLPIPGATPNLAVGATANFDVSTTHDMSVNGTYNYAISTSTTGDGNTLNDAVTPNPTRLVSRFVSAPPHNEQFSALPNPPYGVQQLAGTGNWSIVTAGTLTNPALTPINPGFAYFNSYNFGTGTRSRLVLPCMNFSSLTAPQIRFRMAQSSAFGPSATEGVYVVVSTDGGVTYTPTPLLFAPRYNAAVTAGTGVWTEFTASLCTFAGNSSIRIGLEALSNFGDNIAIDELTVENAPGCALPGAGSVTAITPTSATLNWGPSCGAVSYTVQWGPVGGPYTVVPGLTGLSFNITSGLTFGTNYQFQVAADCGSGIGAYTNFVNWLVPFPPPINDNCPGSTLTVNSTCVYTAGTTLGSTASAVPSMTCSGFTQTPDDEVWYQFTTNAVPGTNYEISVQGLVNFDPVVAAYNNSSCLTPTLLGCVDATFNGGTEVLLLTGLPVNTIHRIRVWDYFTGTANQGNFNICVRRIPPPPPNDNCTGAIALANGVSCAPIGGYNTSATPSTPASTCFGTANDDVWYSFVATATSQDITVVGNPTFNPVIELLTGVCTGLTTLTCADLSGAGGTEVIAAAGLSVGATYFVRVYDFNAGFPADSSFTICVNEGLVLAPPPANDNCASATAITSGPTCTLTPGTTIGATNITAIPGSLCSGFVGNPDDDVWFSFAATATAQIIRVYPQSPLDAVVELRSGACNGTLLGCIDAAGSAATEGLFINGLTIGTTYRVRVYGRGAGSTTQGNFDICVKDTVGPPPPANDNCAGAISLTSGATCSYVTGNVTGATQSTPGSPCGGTSDDDVWYFFTASSSAHNVQVQPSAGFDAVVEVLSGACGTLTSVICQDFAGNGGLETINLTGLTVGTQYRIRIYDFAAGAPTTATFQVCVTTVTPPPPPANDNCSGAIALTPGSVCTPVSGTVAGATASGNPITCGGTANDDVWYRFDATSSIHKVQVNGSASFNPVLEVFSGTGCGALVNLACANASFAGGTEVVTLNGLTVGQTYYIRVYDFLATIPATLTFTVCVITIPPPPIPVNDLCADAININCGDLISGQNSNGGTSTGEASLTASCGTSGSMATANGIWYKTTGNGNSFEVSTCNFNSYDTKIAVYTGSCGAWTCVAGNDDTPNCGNGLASKVQWTTTNGTTYLILVGGFGGQQGIFQLELACCNVPTVGGTTTVTPVPSSTVVNDAFTFGVTGQTGAPVSWEYAFNAGFAPIAGTFAAFGPTITVVNNVNGTLYLRANVSNGPGCATVSSTGVTVTPRCASPINGQPPVTGSYISNVTFAGINNNSSYDATADQYQDFQSISANVQRGFSYALQIKTPGAGLRGRMVWIDYDGDGSFTGPGEAVITPIAPVAGTTTSIVTIPCVGTGSVSVRMRVMVANVAPNSDPCAAIAYANGEIEEYTVNISGVGRGVWIGAVDDNWANPANWACNVVPTGSDNVVFPLGAANLPARLTSNEDCKDITFQAGSPFFTTTGVNLNGFTLNVKGNWIVTGSPSASVVMSGCNGTVVFNSTLGAQNINGVTTFGNVTVNNSAGLVVNKATGVNCILRTQLGAITTNNLLTLRSSLTQTGLVDPTGTGSITGNLNVQRRIGATGGYHYLSSAVSGASVASTSTGWADDFPINSATDGYVYDPTVASVPGSLWPTVWEYDETNPDPNPSFGWIGATGAGDAITPLKGFACITPASAMVDVFGPPTNGTVNFNVTKASDGFNLLGNPYPSPISWSAFIATNGARLSNTYSAFVASGGYAGNYGTWNGTTGTLGVGNVIASSQSFFVTATSAGAVTAQNTHRTTDVNPAFFGYTSVPDLLRMEVQGNNAADETVLYFDPAATDGFSTANDGLKILASSPGIPSIFTIADNQNLAINAMSHLNQDRSVPLGVFIQTGGQYNLVATDFSSFGPSAMIYLEDAVAGTMQNLRVNNTYNVQLAPGTYTNRFFLHIRPAVQFGSQSETCAGNDGAITINYPSASTVDIVVFDANGQSVNTLNAFQGTTQINNLADGNYSVQVSFNGGYQVTDYVQVAAGNSVNASITASTQTVDLGNNTPVVFTANVSGATSYTWNFGDGTVITNAPANVSHTFTSAGVYEVRFEATNQACTSTVTTTVSAVAPSGIQNNTSEAVKVFGIENRVTVQFGNIADGKGRIEVLNMLGQNMVSVDVTTTKGTREIEVPNVAVGHYLVRVTTAEKVYTQKVYLTK